MSGYLRKIDFILLLGLILRYVLVYAEAAIILEEEKGVDKELKSHNNTLGVGNNGDTWLAMTAKQRHFTPSRAVDNYLQQAKDGRTRLDAPRC